MLFLLALSLVPLVASWTTQPLPLFVPVLTVTPRFPLGHVQRKVSSRPRLLTPRFVSATKVDDLEEHQGSLKPESEPPLINGQTTEGIDWTKNIVNGMILLTTLGYAAYTILDVDHGMTRGWTQSELALRIPFDNWARYETALSEHGVYTKTAINVIIYLLGDWCSQTLFQKKNVLDFDPWRTMRNGFIGLCFGPLVHEYYQFSDYILPVEGGLLNRLCKILMDQTIYLTVKCSIYIMAVGLLAGDSFETSQNSVKTRIKGIVFAAWRFWPLVHCITYSVIPARHRILWVNCVDLIWSAILASMSNAKPETQEEEATAAASTEPDFVAAPLQAVSQDSLDSFILIESLAPELKVEKLETVDVVVDTSTGTTTSNQRD